MAKKDKTKDKVMSRYRQAEDARNPREELWEECYQMYRAYREEREDDKSNLFIPYLFGLIETIVPRLTNTLFQKSPVIKPLPVEPSDIENAEAQEVLLDYQIRKSRLKEKTVDWIKEAVIYGNGYVKVFWDEQTETVIKKKERELNNPLQLIDFFNKAGGNASRYIEVEEEITKYEGNNIEVVDIFDLYIDPYAEDIENARYVIHKTLVPIEKIKDRIERGVYSEVDLDDLEDIKGAFTEQDEHSPLQRQADVGMASKPASDEGMVEILEYWEDNKVITLAGRDIVLRNEPNPYHHKKIPFVDMVDTKIPKEHYGMGEIEPNRYLQAELNTNRNQRIENVKMAINNMWAYMEGRIDPDDLKSEPNKAIPIKNTEDIRKMLMPIQTQPIDASAYTEEDRIKLDMQETSGITKYLRGIEPQGSATATEITSMQNEANYRIKQKLQNGIRALEKLGEMMVANNQQFINDTQYIRISNDRQEKLNFQQPATFGGNQVMENAQKAGYSFLEMNPEAIAGQFDVTVASSALEPLADKQVKRQQLLELFQVASQQGIQLPSLFKEIAETYDDPDVDQMLKEYKEQMERQQQLEQLKFQAQNKPRQSQQVGSQPQQPNMMSQMGGFPNG